MTAEVILLPNQTPIESPLEAPPDERAYALDLEQENLDLRNALAEAELRALRGSRGNRRAGVGLAILIAFGAGWVLTPPHSSTATAQGITATPESLPSEEYAIERRSRRTPGAPRLLDEAACYGRSV